MAPTTTNEDGFWGRPTATIDWCEVNYDVTPLVAEFWNTVSNILMILPPAGGAYFAWKDSIGFHFVLSNLFLLAVGLGSWSFHMTLLYEMQLFDELPMLYGSCVLLYCLTVTLSPKWRRNKWLLAALFSYSFLVTVIYLIIKTPIFYQISYGVLVAIIFFMDLYLTRTKKCEPKLFVIGALMYLFGFFLWNIDNAYCSSLHIIRGDLLLPIRPFTQLHAWWHCLAGYATYMHILFCQHASMLDQKQKCAFSCSWLAGLTVRKLVKPLSNNQHSRKRK